MTRRRLDLDRREILLRAKATAVFAQCGFADDSAFFRAYKKHFGYPPAVTQ
ncbi:MAG: helix-turn-helix transcriptional regulator, partial [Peptococcaceae bacterium]|nr:helix-turn-helix transcriptional regulator [Peptococcaceae bacterium]